MADGIAKIFDLNNVLYERLDRQKIAMENLSMREECRYGKCVLAITGKAHVTNIFYEKYFFARVTFDHWTTYKDFPGSWLGSSADGKSDVFTFGFVRPERKAMDIEFALCCVQGGKYEMWDNNNGENFMFHVNENLAD